MQEITVGFGLMAINNDPLVLGMKNLVHRLITDTCILPVKILFGSQHMATV
jgi:hypothetical protein